MSHLPAVPEVVLLDFLPGPGEIQGIIGRHLPLLDRASALPQARGTVLRPAAPPRRDPALVLLDFLPSLGAVDEVIKDHQKGPSARPSQGKPY